MRDPFADAFAWRLDSSLNAHLLEKEFASVEGEHNFQAFRSSADTRTNTVRTIYSARCVCAAAQNYRLEIEGNGFMHRMVRMLVGAAVDVARGRIPAGSMRASLLSGERVQGARTAPAHGLVLDAIALNLPREGVGDSWPPSSDSKV